MILTTPSHEILAATPEAETIIETAGRTCYKSEGKGNPQAFVKRIVDSGHESVIEHMVVTVRLVTDRGISHQLVRHRLASVSQESTRYCNYGKEKFGGHVTFVIPTWYPEIPAGELSQSTVGDNPFSGRFYDNATEAGKTWLMAMINAEKAYFALLAREESPEQARSVLPNSTKTEVVMTANAREWRHIFAVRCHPAAHVQFRELICPVRDEFVDRWPAVFGRRGNP